MIEEQPKIFKLSNGIRVVYSEVASRVSHLGISILAGSRHENDKEVGLAHYLEHCIFKGTSKRRAFHVLSRLDSVGGELNAYTAKEEMVVYASFTNEHLKRSSELLQDITFNSNFPIKEIEKEKEIVLDEINSYLDSPSDKIFDDFEANLFAGQGLGNNILGTKESVRSFTQDDLKNYITRFFCPTNIVLSYVGNASEKEVEKVLEKDFGKLNLTGESVEPEKFTNYTPFSKRSKEANYQSHIVIGGLAPGYMDDDRRIVTLLLNILGGPALNSKLILSVREKYGYAYNVEANYTPYKEIGFWTVYAGTDPKYTNKTIKLIKRELNWFKKTLLSPTQLKQAKEQFKGHLALAMDSNSGLMLGLGKSLLIFDSIDSLEQIYESIDRITAEEIQLAAQKYFAEDQLSELIFDVKD